MSACPSCCETISKKLHFKSLKLLTNALFIHTLMIPPTFKFCLINQPSGAFWSMSGKHWPYRLKYASWWAQTSSESAMWQLTWSEIFENKLHQTSVLVFNELPLSVERHLHRQHTASSCDQHTMTDNMTTFTFFFSTQVTCPNCPVRLWF